MQNFSQVSPKKDPEWFWLSCKYFFISIIKIKLTSHVNNCTFARIFTWTYQMVISAFGIAEHIIRDILRECEDVDADPRLGGFHTFHAFIEAISQQFLPDARRTFYTRHRIFMNEKKVKKINVQLAG